MFGICNVRARSQRRQQSQSTTNEDEGDKCRFQLKCSRDASAFVCCEEAKSIWFEFRFELAFSCCRSERLSFRFFYRTSLFLPFVRS